MKKEGRFRGLDSQTAAPAMYNNNLPSMNKCPDSPTNRYRHKLMKALRKDESVPPQISEAPPLSPSNRVSVLPPPDRQMEMLSKPVPCPEAANSYKRNQSPSLDRTPEEPTSLPEVRSIASPGPLLGNTRLVDEPKRLKLDTSLCSIDTMGRPSRSNALQMFGGEVSIVAETGESHTMRIERQLGKAKSPSTTRLSTSETTSVVVRSGLQSGGMMLHKSGSSPPAQQSSHSIDLRDIAPRIEPPNIAPSISYFKTKNIPHGSRLTPFVPGIPGPQTASPSTIVTTSSITLVSNQEEAVEKLTITELAKAREIPTAAKFSRPSSLPLAPGTFTPKRHHGITPTANTLPLISPETPRSKKSYGQLYLNGHAYTYLDLKCSTRVFYCTINRTQPMYALHRHGLSMYSNWKICKDVPPEFELQQYDSRQRPLKYTLAGTATQGILTHSTYRSATPCSPDSGLESDNQDKSKRIRICDGGFESNEDYTYIRGRGRGRYVCEECGIRCRKPSMLKKHIRTHTDVRPYTCKHCAFSFKTKGNLTKHLKSKAHYKKCIELNVLPVPTSVCDENIDKEALGKLASIGVDDASSSDEDSEQEGESDYSENEEHEAAQSLLNLASRSCERYRSVPGSSPLKRPATYPYENTRLIPEPNASRISVIRSFSRGGGGGGGGGGGEEEASSTETPIDLSKKQTPQALVHRPESSPDADHVKVHVPDRKLFDRGTPELRQDFKLTTYNVDLDSKDIEKIDPQSSQQFVMQGNTLIAQEQKGLEALEPVNVAIGKSLNPAKDETVEQSHKQEVPSVHKVVVGGTEFESKSPLKTIPAIPEWIRGNSVSTSNYASLTEDSCVCSFCNRKFRQPSQLRLHINVHYIQKQFKCQTCGQSFRNKNRLIEHERSPHAHKNQMSDPRPFKCTDCSISFRIHGHLAKHLRSKMHIMKLECLHKLPFGTFAEMENSKMNLHNIDTTDCDTSLISLQIIAQKLFGKDPSNQIDQLDAKSHGNMITSAGELSSDESDLNLSNARDSKADVCRANSQTNMLTVNNKNNIKDADKR